MIAVLARVVAAVLVLFQQASYWSSDKTVDQALNSDAIIPITGLILARGGSKGIPNKNLQLLHGVPLVRRSIDAMLQSKAFHDIWVSTDDPVIKMLALNAGVMVHDRAAYTATDHATSMSAVQEFLEVHSSVQAIGLVQCTSPFLKSEDLVAAAMRLNSGKCDSVFSVTRSHQLRWSVALNSDFVAKPLNFDPKFRPRRQDWEGEFVENGMFYFTKRKLLEKGVFQNDRSCVVEIPKNRSLEIDTIEDLKLAEILMTGAIIQRDKPTKIEL